MSAASGEPFGEPVGEPFGEPFHVIIPARYASTRLPGKPLQSIHGRPMVLHVIDRARSAGAASVSVATDDERIRAAVEADAIAGVRALMTRVDHPSGSDRVMEAADQLGLRDDAMVLNVQGDEPFIPPSAIRAVAEALAKEPSLGAATLAQPFSAAQEAQDPNAVKVVRSLSGRALYFSRAAIPYERDPDPNPASRPAASLHHLGIYGFRLATLRRFVALPVAELERLEALEQLRLLANDIELQVALAPEPVPRGVDTRADLERLRAAGAAGTTSAT